MKRKLYSVFAVLALFLGGCTPPERVAYNTIVASKGFLDSARKQHPECTATSTSTVCVDLVKATKAKDALIDVVEIVCAGPTFSTGGACNFPAKGTPAYQQAMDKLNAAVASYNQIATELKGIL